MLLRNLEVKTAKNVIEASAQLLQLLYNVYSFKYCVNRYRTLKKWKDINGELSKEAEKEFNDIKKALKDIIDATGNYVIIPGKQVIEFFDKACKKMRDKLIEQEEQK